MVRKRYELLGETLREIGILILVFVPLDILLQPNAAPHWWIIVIFVGIGFILIVLGIWIEAGEK